MQLLDFGEQYHHKVEELHIIWVADDTSGIPAMVSVLNGTKVAIVPNLRHLCMRWRNKLSRGRETAGILGMKRYVSFLCSIQSNMRMREA